MEGLEKPLPLELAESLSLLDLVDIPIELAVPEVSTPDLESIWLEETSVAEAGICLDLEEGVDIVLDVSLSSAGLEGRMTEALTRFLSRAPGVDVGDG